MYWKSSDSYKLLYNAGDISVVLRVLVVLFVIDLTFNIIEHPVKVLFITLYLL